MSIERLREAINEAYELSKGLDDSTDEMDERKRAVVDDLRSAQFSLDMYEESTWVLSRVEVDVDATITVIVKHKANQYPSDAAVQYIDNYINIDCEHCRVDINDLSASKLEAIKIDMSEDLDITEEE